jgi:hypothetical protein
MSTSPDAQSSSGSDDAFDSRRDVLALQCIRSMNPTLYVDIVGDPTIVIPFGVNAESSRPHRLRSQPARDYLCFFIEKETRLIPFDHEINRLTNILAGQAQQDQRIEYELKEALEKSPVLEVIYVFLTSDQLKPKHRFRGVGSKLKEQLDKVARQCGIDPKLWPQGAPQLTRLVGELSRSGTLNRFGITFSRPDKSHPRLLELAYQDPNNDAAPTALNQRRDRNPGTEQDVESTNGDYGAVPKVFNRIQAPSGEI